MSFLEIILHFSHKKYIFFIILISSHIFYFLIVTRSTKNSTLCQNNFTLISITKLTLGFELSPGNSTYFFQSYSETNIQEQSEKHSQIKIVFYFNDNFKIRLGLGQKILEFEMENVQASQSCFGKISIDRTKNCCCLA